MDLLSAIATCSLHGDITLVVTMAMTFSHGNPYTVQNVAEIAAPSYASEQEDPLRLPVPSAIKAPKSRAEAEAQLRNIVANDGAPVVGLLPVPVSWAALFGRKPAELLSPCINVSIATAKLSEFEYECGGKAGRNCVLQQYAQAVGMDYFEQDVLAELAAQGLSKSAAAVIETEEMLRAPVKTDEADDRGRQWGADRLFFVLSDEGAKPSSPSNRTSAHHAPASPQPKK